MHDEKSHPLLQQTPLSVNPFIDLPKPPTLAHNYATIPSTLPPSSISAPLAASGAELPAYVTSSSGFAAHPSTIIAQNKALLEQINTQQEQANAKVKEWEERIHDRELAEKRRKAPGWLDSEHKILQPVKPLERGASLSSKNIMDDASDTKGGSPPLANKDKEVDELGAAMDRAFGGNTSA